MVTCSRLGRLVVALSAAALVGLALAACDSAPARSPLGPSLTGGQSASANAATGTAQLLGKIRSATAKYQNIDAAFADGYIDDGFGCIDSALIPLDGSIGGMGFH